MNSARINVHVDWAIYDIGWIVGANFGLMDMDCSEAEARVCDFEFLFEKLDGNSIITTGFTEGYRQLFQIPCARYNTVTMYHPCIL
jgi:hypothetical protein